jgi:hypothetical protein
VQHPAHREHGAEVHRDQVGDRRLVLGPQKADRHRRAHDQGGAPEGLGDAPPGPEREHEAQKVGGQRQHPQQRHRRDLGPHGLGGAQEHARGDEGEQHPLQPLAQGGRRFRGDPDGVPVRAVAHHDAAGQDAGHVQPVTGRPEAALGCESAPRQGEERLEQEGVGQQAGQAPQVAGRVEEVGVACLPVPAPGEPGLDERSSGSQHEEREADRARQQRQEPERRCMAARAFPAGGQVQGEHERRPRQHHDVDEELPPGPEPARQCVGVGVARQQQRLEEQHAGDPDGGAPSQTGEDHLGHHRLDQEEEGGPEQDGEGEERQEHERRNVPLL